MYKGFIPKDSKGHFVVMIFELPDHLTVVIVFKRSEKIMSVWNFFKYHMHKIITKIKNITNKRNCKKLLDDLARFQDIPFDPFPQGKNFLWTISDKFWNYFFVYFQKSKRVIYPQDANLIYRWGVSKLYKIMPYFRDKKIYLVEDGFLRSVTTNSDKFATEREKSAIGFVVDDLAPHFCATHTSRLEQYIKNMALSVPEKERAAHLIDYILNNHLTKYNHQPCCVPDILKTNQHKVLIIDQSYGDFSVVVGGDGKRKDFERMLKDAVDENPNSLIFVKVHPDALAKGSRAKGYYNRKNTKYPQVILFGENVNPVCILQAVDKVYVWSSGMGFEAVMLGKDVVTYGTPFYAGWGLTTDRHPIFSTDEMKHRRFVKRTKEDLFYASYIWYTHYVNPDTHKKCSIEEALEWLKVNRISD